MAESCEALRAYMEARHEHLGGHEAAPGEIDAPQRLGLAVRLMLDAVRESRGVAAPQEVARALGIPVQADVERLLANACAERGIEAVASSLDSWFELGLESAPAMAP